MTRIKKKPDEKKNFELIGERGSLEADRRTEKKNAVRTRNQRKRKKRKKERKKERKEKKGERKGKERRDRRVQKKKKTKQKQRITSYTRKD